MTADLVMGVMIMGITGFVIGLNLGGPFTIAAASFLGVLLGGFVSTFKARRFFFEHPVRNRTGSSCSGETDRTGRKPGIPLDKQIIFTVICRFFMRKDSDP